MSGTTRRATALLLVTASALTIAVVPASAAPDPAPGSAGLGDRLLPGLGNGGYDAEEYTVDFRFEPGVTTMAGRTAMTARATAALSRFNLDFAGGVVHEVRVDGRRAGFRTEGEELVITPDRPLRAGRAFRTEVRYTTDRSVKLPSPVDETAGWGNTADGGFALWAQPDRAHQFFPVNDHPSDKARFTYRVDAPEGWTVVANGIRTGERTGGGRTVVTHTTRHPITSQVAQLAVGKLDLVTGTGPHGLPLRSAVAAGHLDRVRPALAKISGHLSWLEGKIGRRFPLETYGVLAIDGHRPTQTEALENPTLSTFLASGLANLEQAEPVLVHEAAHQWFGNSISFRGYDDVWLSEGFATYLGQLWEQEHGGQSVPEVLRRIYGADQEARTALGSIVVSKEPNGIFGLARAGGALVVYALRQAAGEQTFQRILQAFLDQYRDAGASTADFERVVAETGGPELAAVLRDWLHSPATPPMPGHPDWKPGS
ncbi:M1 family metallopeptidase [Crossiella sp. CA-258035]|uniref:M1 family metallopeptidase n=1 Tax=Crossiella sp. CA-258035 TaxID=2981138 RepID=UPI0024BCA778|nr:M1 family metallopeptidase [Crossiella sp. CA-258035]WHT22177.1 M1 family metallopeptidase [Crossiella sp. CA-258035]